MNHAIAALLLGLVGCVALYPAFLGVLARLHAGQRVKDYNPASHAAKAGTPTMGGLLFGAAVVIAWLLLDRSRAGFVLVFAVLAGGAIGWLDDIANIRGSAALGLGAVQKLALQGVAGILIGIGLYMVGATQQHIPWLGSPSLGIAIVPLAAIAVVACSNAVNLTDGVDGLAGSCCAVAFVALLVVALHLHAVPAVVATAATVGGLVAFLLFNWFPARVFMGDTGSLALGCLLVAVCCELQLLWLLPLLGIVFVAETLSVIINVTAVRRFRRRVFRASPSHHHFEEIGLREDRLVVSFTLVSAIAAIATLILARDLGALP